MLKISLAVRKNKDGSLTTLYIGEDAGEAIKVYKSEKGELYLFEKCRHSRAKDTAFEPVKTEATQARRRAV